MSTRRYVVLDALTLLVNNFGGMLVGLIGTVLITRALGPEARGIYAWVMTLAGLASQLAMLVPYNTVRQLGSVGGQANKPNEKNWPALAGTITGLTLLGWVLTLPMVVWALYQPIGATYAKLLAIAWMGIPLTALSASLNGLLHLRGGPFNIMLPTLTPRVLVTLLVVLGWALHSLTLGVAVGITPLLSALGVMFSVAWLGIPWRKWRFNPAYARQIGYFLGATWAASLTAFLAPKIVLLILPHYTGLAQLGFYSIAATLLDVAMMVPNAVSNALISHFTRGESNAQNRRQTMYVLSALMVGAGAFGAVTAPYLLPMIFGPAFIAAVAPFRILLLALLIQGPLTVYTSQLVARTKPAGLLFPPISALLATAAGAFWLIPQYGINGAAMAVVAGYAIQLLTTLPFCRKSAK